MTRLAIVGSSHVGAIRQNDVAIRAAHPGLDIAYFALPGAPFRRAGRDADGVFRAHPAGPAEARLIERINGATTLDLRPFDHVWTVGHRYGLGRILRLYLNFDVLEGARTGRAGTVSAAFAAAATAAEIAASTARIAAQFGADPRLICTPAPYPAQSARQPGPHHEPPLAHILGHPDRAEIFAEFEAGIVAALAARGFGALLQPEDTRAQPFATQTRFLRDARDFRDPARQTADLRHMNAAYGMRLFQGFADRVLTRGARPPKHDISQKRS